MGKITKKVQIWTEYTMVKNINGDVSCSFCDLYSTCDHRRDLELCSRYDSFWKKSYNGLEKEYEIIDVNW